MRHNTLIMLAAAMLLTVGCAPDVYKRSPAATAAQTDTPCGDGHVTTHLHPESGEVHIDLHGYSERAILRSPAGPGFAFCAARAVHDALLAPSIHAALADVQPQTGPTVTVEGRRVVLSGFERIDKSDGVLILDQSYANARALTDGLTAAFARIDGHAHPHDHDSFHLPDPHALPSDHAHGHTHDDDIPFDHDH